MTSAAVVFGAQRIVNAGILVGLVVCSVLFCMDPAVDSPYLYAVIALSLLFGVMAVLPIGGAEHASGDLPAQQLLGPQLPVLRVLPSTTIS